MAACARGTPKRWLHLAAVSGTAAHHGFELGAGVGLVFQPYLGLGGALAAWGAALPAWAAGAVVAGRRARRRGTADDAFLRAADAVLAFLAGVSVAGALLHFRLWPVELRPAGRWYAVPVLVQAEGLKPRQLPVYNAVLYAWSIGSLAAVAVGTPGRRRWWALPGLLAAQPLTRSARHHFEWLGLQAAVNPRWWNRAVGPAGS
jgi:hypothetical protein